MILGFFLMCIYSTVLSQVNRYSDFKYSNLNDIDLLNPYEGISELLKAKYEKKIKTCYRTLIETCRKSAKNKEAEFDYIEPNSSWIMILEFYKINKTGFSGCYLMTKNKDYYFFHIDKSMWLKWKNSDSTGKFFNDYIRGKKEYSFLPLCEALID